MIGDIRNPWVRRTVLVGVPVWLVLQPFAALEEYVREEWGDVIRDAWRGPRG